MNIVDSPRTGRARSVMANGIDIQYVEQGQGDPLVLLHGGLVTTNPIWKGAPVAYATNMDAFAEHFRVIAPDTRGAGRPVHVGGGPVTFDLLADDVIGLIEALGLESPHSVGFSEGAVTSTIVALRSPGLARAIVNHAGYDFLNPEAQSLAMMRQMLGGSPVAQVADPDAAARFFEQSEEMRGPFELMKADQDAGQGEGHLARILAAGIRPDNQPSRVYGGRPEADNRPNADPGRRPRARDHFCSVEEGVAAYRALADGSWRSSQTPHMSSPWTRSSARLIAFLRRRS